MEVTSAVHSVGFLHLQTQYSSHVERLKSRPFFISTKIRGRRKFPVACYHHPNHFSNGGRHSSSRSGSIIINSTSATTAASTATSGAAESLSEVENIKQRCLTWQWNSQYSINYFVSSDADSPHANHPPLLLVHGFGASIPHWRRNIKTLAQNYTVYAIDLLGFGASDKPSGFSYTMETWAQLILDFLNEVIQKPTVLIGNSVGSLACVIAASGMFDTSPSGWRCNLNFCKTVKHRVCIRNFFFASSVNYSLQPDSSQTLVRGIVLLNCAGGMNNKAIVDDWRIKLLLPLLWLFDFLLKQKGIASAIFERVKQRENLRNILSSVYVNKESVDEELVEIIRVPANDPGALDAFISIVTGPPGPNPVQLMPKISLPVLLLWGDQDPFTPLDGPVGKYFSSLPSQQENVKLFVLEGVGHCPHDDRPDLVHEILLPWLANLSNS